MIWRGETVNGTAAWEEKIAGGYSRKEEKKGKEKKREKKVERSREDEKKSMAVKGERIVKAKERERERGEK